MLAPLKFMINVVLYKLLHSYGACLKTDEMLFSQISNSHSHRVVLVSVSQIIMEGLLSHKQMFFIYQFTTCFSPDRPTSGDS
jgi:hypothetical protein